MRSLRVAVVVIVAVTALAGCGKRDDQADDRLRSAIRRTAALAHRFVYVEETPSRKFEVRGDVEDDFRYRARLSVNNLSTLDEIVYDDALADKVRDPGSLASLLVPGTEGSPVVADLTAGRWVVDPVGAPSLQPSPTQRRRLGDDIVFDSLTVLRYVETGLRQQRVREFDENSLEYRPKEDKFPKPKEGSDITRYDFVLVPMPKPSQGGSANQAVPGTPNFRKLSAYVKDGVIIRILEHVDVVARLDTLRRNYDLDLPENLSDEKQAAIAIDAINQVRLGQGEDPIRVRSLSVTLRDLGEKVTVELPKENLVEGRLSVLRGRGRQVRRSGSGATPAATTTTTAAA